MVNESLICVVYVSSANRLMADEELMTLLEQSQNNNQQNKITGLLLYSEGNFIQVLEGPKSFVASLFPRICRDPRHHSVIKLLEFETERRNFPEWSMGFKRLQRSALDDIPGFTTVIERRHIQRDEFEECADKVWALIETFGQISLRY